MNCHRTTYQRHGLSTDKNKKIKKAQALLLPFFIGRSTLMSFRVYVDLNSGQVSCPDSSEVEHLHGKQAVVGSIPILGKGIFGNKKKYKAPTGGEHG